MRISIALCLVLILAACAAPLQTAPQATSPVGAPQATAAEGNDATVPGSSAVLTFWNGVQPEIHLFDLAAGQDAPGFAPIHALPQAFSPDGKKLAAIESHGDSCEGFAGGTSCRGNAAVLHLVDLNSWKEITAPVSTKGWAWPMAFSPDAGLLALAYHEPGLDELLLFDTASGEVKARQQLFFRPSQIGFASGGSQIVVYGQALGKEPGISEPEPPHLMLLDTTSLKVEWDQPMGWILSGSWCMNNCEAPHEQREWISLDPAVVLTPDGAKLYIVHAGDDMLTTVDIQARLVTSQRIAEQQSWLEKILALTAGTALAKGEVSGTTKAAALSADGKLLFVIEEAMSGSTGGSPEAQPSKPSPGLKMIDVETGHILASRDTQGSLILLTPDGAHLLVEDWSTGVLRTKVFDANTLAPVTELEGWQVRFGQPASSQPVLLASRSTDNSTQLGILDPQTFEIPHPWTVQKYAFWAGGQ